MCNHPKYIFNPEIYLTVQCIHCGVIGIPQLIGGFKTVLPDQKITNVIQIDDRDPTNRLEIFSIGNCDHAHVEPVPDKFLSVRCTKCGMKGTAKAIAGHKILIFP